MWSWMAVIALCVAPLLLAWWMRRNPMAWRGHAPADPEVVSFQMLQRVRNSGIAEPGIRVARDQHEREQLWAAMWAHYLPGPDLPVVDWIDPMIVAVGIGMRPSGSYTVEIERLTCLGGVLTVHARETRPAPDEQITDDEAHPVHAVMAKRHDGEVRLVLEVTVRSSWKLT
ncbi:MAG: hypothetical protein JWN00_989 [Actinomycetia bacterium]|nr:hypothetical protein [Actinomycetes bacterium]